MISGKTSAVVGTLIEGVKQRPFRFVAAVGGLAASIAVTVLMSHLIRALWVELAGGLEQAGRDLVLISPNPQRAVLGLERHTISDRDVASIERKVPSIEHVVRLIGLQGSLDACGHRLIVQIIGVLPAQQRLEQWHLVRGRFVTSVDAAKTAAVVVLSTHVRQQLGCVAVDDQVTLSGRPFRVVGEVEPHRIAFGPAPSAVVLIPFTTVRDRYPVDGLNGAGAIAEVRYGINIHQAQTQLQSALAVLYHTRPNEAPPFNVQSGADLLSRIQIMSDKSIGILFLVVGVGILVAAINTVNSVSANVVERFAEIGLRRCVGATRRDVQRMVIGEALLVWLVGSVIGCSGGWSVYVVVARRMHLTIFIDWPVIGGLSFAALLLTTAGAAWPAAVASNVAPVVALTHE